MGDNPCGVDGCEFTNTGECAVHGFEIERRENLAATVSEISEGVAKLTAFMNSATGTWQTVKWLGIIIILGSYSLALILSGINAKVNDAQDDRIDKLVNIVAESEAQHNAFLRKIEIVTEDVKK